MMGARCTKHGFALSDDTQSVYGNYRVGPEGLDIPKMYRKISANSISSSTLSCHDPTSALKHIVHRSSAKKSSAKKVKQSSAKKETALLRSVESPTAVKEERKDDIVGEESKTIHLEVSMDKPDFKTVERVELPPETETNISGNSPHSVTLHPDDVSSMASSDVNSLSGAVIIERHGCADGQDDPDSADYHLTSATSRSGCDDDQLQTDAQSDVHGSDVHGSDVNYSDNDGETCQLINKDASMVVVVEEIAHHAVGESDLRSCSHVTSMSDMMSVSVASEQSERSEQSGHSSNSRHSGKSNKSRSSELSVDSLRSACFSLVNSSNMERTTRPTNTSKQLSQDTAHIKTTRSSGRSRDRCLPQPSVDMCPQPTSTDRCPQQQLTAATPAATCMQAPATNSGRHHPQRSSSKQHRPKHGAPSAQHSSSKHIQLPPANSVEADKVSSYIEQKLASHMTQYVMNSQSASQSKQCIKPISIERTPKSKHHQQKSRPTDRHMDSHLQQQTIHEQHPQQPCAATDRTPKYPPYQRQGGVLHYKQHGSNLLPNPHDHHSTPAANHPAANHFPTYPPNHELQHPPKQQPCSHGNYPYQHGGNIEPYYQQQKQNFSSPQCHHPDPNQQPHQPCYHANQHCCANMAADSRQSGYPATTGCYQHGGFPPQHPQLQQPAMHHTTEGLNCYQCVSQQLQQQHHSGLQQTSHQHQHQYHHEDPLSSGASGEDEYEGESSGSCEVKIRLKHSCHCHNRTGTERTRNTSSGGAPNSNAVSSSYNNNAHMSSEESREDDLKLLHLLETRQRMYTTSSSKTSSSRTTNDSTDKSRTSTRTTNADSSTRITTTHHRLHDSELSSSQEESASSSRTKSHNSNNSNKSKQRTSFKSSSEKLFQKGTSRTYERLYNVDSSRMSKSSERLYTTSATSNENPSCSPEPRTERTFSALTSSSKTQQRKSRTPDSLSSKQQLRRSKSTDSAPHPSCASSVVLNHSGSSRHNNSHKLEFQPASPANDGMVTGTRIPPRFAHLTATPTPTNNKLSTHLLNNTTASTSSKPHHQQHFDKNRTKRRPAVWPGGSHDNLLHREVQSLEDALISNNITSLPTNQKQTQVQLTHQQIGGHPNPSEGGQIAYSKTSSSTTTEGPTTTESATTSLADPLCFCKRMLGPGHECECKVQKHTHTHEHHHFHYFVPIPPPQ